jgi:hypothetical protein
MKDDLYWLHQTPSELCKDIISNIPFESTDILLEPFAGEGFFFDNFPEELPKYRTEIEDGLDFRDFDYEGTNVNTIITNPPFRIDGRNSFFDILMFFSRIHHIKKMYILCSAICFESLTPIRTLKLNEAGMYLNKITCVNVKKWRGRYYILSFSRVYNECFDYYLPIY